MIFKTKVMHDPSGVVHKLVFESGNAIAESVGYAYGDRRVVCLSVQSGCRIGCEFCGTGKRFIRNLTAEEMHTQLGHTITEIGYKQKLQVMTMSMGEPMDNWNATIRFIEEVFKDQPTWDVFVSTVGLRKREVLSDLLYLGQTYDHFGLQFSLHHWDNQVRWNRLGRYPHLLSVEEISAFGKLWSHWSGRPAYFNYICKGDENEQDALRVAELVNGMHLTCSVWCDTGNFVKGKVEPAARFSEMVAEACVSVVPHYVVERSVFNPAGQDTIGGGCGQLLFVQDKLKRLGIEPHYRRKAS